MVIRRGIENLCLMSEDKIMLNWKLLLEQMKLPCTESVWILPDLDHLTIYLHLLQVLLRVMLNAKKKALCICISNIYNDARHDADAGHTAIQNGIVSSNRNHRFSNAIRLQ